MSDITKNLVESMEKKTKILDLMADQILDIQRAIAVLDDKVYMLNQAVLNLSGSVGSTDSFEDQS